MSNNRLGMSEPVWQEKLAKSLVVTIANLDGFKRGLDRFIEDLAVSG